MYERVDYHGTGLLDDQLPDTPWELLSQWVQDARVAGVGGFESPEGMAMSFATVDVGGCPNVRTVLVRFLDPQGPGFVTDTTSTKARELDDNPQCAGSIGWPSVFRVVRFRGVAVPVEPAALERYFVARPWGSRISALASKQSSVCDDRAQLDALFDAHAARHPDTGRADDVPVPASWGGYRLRSWEVEFWAGREARLHDRIVYEIQWPVADDPGQQEKVRARHTWHDQWPALDETRWHRFRRMP